MNFFISWIYLLSLSLWVGGMVFFSFFTTPVVFSNLPREAASQLLSALFPRYYQLGYVAGTLMLLSTLGAFLLSKNIYWLRLILVLVMLGCTVYAGTVIRPKVHQIKVEQKAVEEGSPLAKKLQQRFDTQHRLSVILNLIVMIAGLFLLGMIVFKLKPL